MLSNIKAYPSETASQRSPSQNSPTGCTPGCLFTKRSVLILTSSCHVRLHSHKMLWFYCLDSLVGPLNPPNGWKRKHFLMCLVGFECPLWSKKKLLLEKENLDSVLSFVLNLKMWILKMRALQAKKICIFEIFDFKMRECTENVLPSS